MTIITSINNLTHDVTIQHSSGKSMSFTVPESQQSREDKIAYIQSQISILDASATAEMKFHSRKRSLILCTVIAAQTIGILFLIGRYVIQLH